MKEVFFTYEIDPFIINEINLKNVSFIKRTKMDIFQLEYLLDVIRNEYLNLNGRVFINANNLKKNFN
jgi:hypothetical protein